jgi:hypothetical protein
VYIPGSGIAGSYGRSMFSFFKPPYCFPKLTFPPAVYEGSFPPAFLPTFVVVGVFDDSYSNEGAGIFSCGFDLHFLHGQGWWAFFHVVFGHLDFFLLKSSV